MNTKITNKQRKLSVIKAEVFSNRKKAARKFSRKLERQLRVEDIFFCLFGEVIGTCFPSTNRG